MVVGLGLWVYVVVMGWIGMEVVAPLLSELGSGSSLMGLRSSILAIQDIETLVLIKALQLSPQFTIQTEQRHV